MPPRKCVYCVSAFRTIEKTGDSSTTLRMTCIAIAIVFRSYLRQTCHPEEAGLKVGQTFLSAHVAEEAARLKMPHAQMCLLCFCLQDNRKDGRFFAALRMTCFCNSHCRSYLRLNCHPEEAGLKVGQTFLSARVAEEALSAVSGTGRRQAEDASAQMCLLCFCLQDNRKDGRK